MTKGSKTRQASLVAVYMPEELADVVREVARDRLSSTSAVIREWTVDGAAAIGAWPKQEERA